MPGSRSPLLPAMDCSLYSERVRTTARSLAAMTYTGVRTGDDVRRWIGQDPKRKLAWVHAQTWFAKQMARQRTVTRDVRAGTR